MNSHLNARSRDLSDLAALEIACFPEPWNAQMLAEAWGDEKYLIELHRDDDSDDDGAAVAYLIGWEVAGEAELARIGVAPSQRGRGWGKKLLERALESWKTRGVTRVWLEVRASNAIAGRLYLSSGFEIVGRRPGYYSDGEDAILMALSLASSSAAS